MDADRLLYADDNYDAYFAKPAETQKLVRELVAEIHRLRNELTAALLERDEARRELNAFKRGEK